VAEVLSGRPRALAFHKLAERLTFGSTNYSPTRFERLLTKLRADGWDLNAGESSPAPRDTRSLYITFDDAYQHLLNVLPPLMERFRFRPLVFVPTSLIGRSNRWDYSHALQPMPHLNRASIRQLAELGVRFGSHGHSHSDLTAVDPDRLNNELLFSKATLEDLLGRKVTAVSYPFGRCNEAVLRKAAETGYEDGYTMRFPAPGDHRLAQGRVAIYGYDTPLTVQLKLGDGPWGRVEALKARITNRLSGGTIWLNRLRRTQPR